MADVQRGEIAVAATEAQIAVHWKEEDYRYPSPKFIGQANLTDPAVMERFSEKNFPECYREYADMLAWDKYWENTLDASNPPFWKWFVGGKLNVCYNCVDRHLAKYKNKAALICVPEPESQAPVVITYQELYVRVNEMAALLRDFAGLKTGDRVTLHMPMIPELPITMLACARLGIVHSVVFGGFSGEACGKRIADSGSRVLITADGYYRNGEFVDHKSATVETAVEIAKSEGQHVDKVLVCRRELGKNASKATMVKGRDYFVDEVLKDFAGKRVDPVSMDSEAPLFLMYTSGTTGKPKGCQHRTGGYLAYVTGTSKYIQDIHPEDVYWCMADIGWITGHSYIVYGPLALAATSVIYEGVPTYPDAGRPWRIAERLGVNIFHTSPTAIRMLRKAGADEPKKYNHHFKHMTTVGEPIEPVGVALVPRCRRQGRSRHRRHVVADRKWWFSLQHKACTGCHEARKRGAGRTRNLPDHLRRGWQRSPSRMRSGRKHLHPESLARDHADDLGRQRAVCAAVLREVLQNRCEQGLA